MRAVRMTSALALALVLGCAPVVRVGVPTRTPPRAIQFDAQELAECQRTPSEDDSAFVEAGPLPSPASTLPADIRDVARAAGVARLLSRLSGEEGPIDDPVGAKLQLVMRLSSLEIQLASLLFETQCLGSEIDAVMRELDRRQQKDEVGLTIASILVGAAAATAGGVWEVRGTGGHGPAALMIGGGVASATLGLAAFIPERRAVVLTHPRNLFGPIVTGEDPDRLYPPFVMRVLLLEGPDGPSVRDDILADWGRILDEGFPPRHRELAEAVLYGEGGIYDGALLSVREQMFDALESHLAGIDHDLELLYRYSATLVELEMPALDANE